MGRERSGVDSLKQKELRVLPTRTIYEFDGAGVKIGLTFLTPALPDDLDVLSRPLTYIEWSVSSTAGAAYRANCTSMRRRSGRQYARPTGLVARYQLDGQPVLRMGSREQAVLAKRGDDLRIDWGYLYLAADRAEGVPTGAIDRDAARAAFEPGQTAGHRRSFRSRRAATGSGLRARVQPRLSAKSARTGSRYLMLAYDDLYSIEYFQRRERPWWRRKGAEATDLLRAARREHDAC